MKIAATLLTCLSLAGCGSSPKAQYYTLQAPPSPAAQSTIIDAAQPEILIGPISLPEAVDRSQWVLRTGDNTLDISDTQRWAEPLKTGIARVLAANLVQLLGTPKVTLFGAGVAADAAVRINIDIAAFESAPGDSATIEALWTIKAAGNGKPLSGRSIVREALPDAGYQAVAAGHGRALAQISREIAAALRQAGYLQSSR